MLVCASRIAASNPAGQRAVDQHIAWVLLTISLLSPEITFPRQSKLGVDWISNFDRVSSLGAMSDTGYLVNSQIEYRISEQISVKTLDTQLNLIPRQVQILKKAGYPVWFATAVLYSVQSYQNSYYTSKK